MGNSLLAKSELLRYSCAFLSSKEAGNTGVVSPPELPAVYLYFSEAWEVQCRLKHNRILSLMLGKSHYRTILLSNTKNIQL